MSAPGALVLPNAWDANKRKAPSVSRSGKRVRRSGVDEYNSKTVQAAIDSQLPAAPDRFECDVCLQLDDVLSQTTFQQHMGSAKLHHEAPVVTEVTRAYEEQYLRESKSGEQPCVMGADCECMHIDRAQPFVGVRFVIPDVRAADNNMCLLCLRRTTHVLFYRVVLKGIQSSVLIQRYGNICNREGEYHPSAMLVCPPSGPVHSMPLPIVAHQRNRYSVVERAGLKYISQHGVGMEDFREPPPPLSV